MNEHELRNDVNLSAGKQPFNGPFDLALLGRFFSERSPQPMLAVEGPNHFVRHVNAAFERLSGVNAAELIGRPFAQAAPEGAANQCLAMLERVYRTGTSENLLEQEHRQTPPAYWSYGAWAVHAGDTVPVGC